MPIWWRNKGGRDWPKRERKLTRRDVVAAAINCSAKLFWKSVVAVLNAKPSTVKEFCERYPPTVTHENYRIPARSLTMTIANPARVGLANAIKDKWVVNGVDLEKLLMIPDYTHLYKRSVIGWLIPHCKANRVIRTKMEYDEVVNTLSLSLSWGLDTSALFAALDNSVGNIDNRLHTVRSSKGFELYAEELRRKFLNLQKSKN